MAERLDMTLDDIIKNNKKSSGSYTNTTFRGGGPDRSRGLGRSRGPEPEPAPGPTRRVDNRVLTRMKPYFVPQAFHVQNVLVGGESSSEAGTRLYISNLDYEVTNEDIKVLFSDVGELKRYAIHYDRGGRSKGTAEVVYMRQSDAVAAMKKYNNLQLDGKPMRLELVGVNIVIPVPIPPMQKGILGTDPINLSQRIVGRGQALGGNVHYRGSERGHGGGRSRPEKVSAADLDADLERIVGRGQARDVHRESERGQSGSRKHPEKLSADDLDADLEKYRQQAMRMRIN
ncbi:putative RNA recognition motif domain, nucleotide-binding alpha-beta plait domain superfamily [Helianthus annuus]|nr:putative RNA recognition motif domain, nucleotide-binding alpha-beta plait domain superfamily [Helianthus annuus]